MGEMDNVWTVERHLQDKRPEVIALYLDLPRLVPDARITRSAPATRQVTKSGWSIRETAGELFPRIRLALRARRQSASLFQVGCTRQPGA